MRKLDQFTTHTFSNGDCAIIYTLKGWHLMKASVNAVGDAQMIIFYLILYSTHVNGNEMTMEYFEELQIDDAMFLVEQVGLQAQKLKI